MSLICIFRSKDNTSFFYQTFLLQRMPGKFLELVSKEIDKKNRWQLAIEPNYGQ